MKKKFYLLVLSLLCVVFAHAEYVAPAEGVFRIINMEYGNAMMENFISHTVSCTSITANTDTVTLGTEGQSIARRQVVATANDASSDVANEDYEQMWVLKKVGAGYSIQNVFTGAYIQTGNDQNNVSYWTGSTECAFNIVENSDWSEVCYNIWDPSLGTRGLHCNESSSVVRWGAEPGKKAASEWRFVKVDITAEQIADIRKEYEALSNVQENRDKYQTVLGEVFEDLACTVLSSTYAAMDVNGLRAALANRLPDVLIDMAVKVKTGEWSEANEKADKPQWDSPYAKKFRVQMIEPYSIQGEITEWIGHQGHTNMDNPTGLYANKRQVLYVMVEGEVKEGAELWACWITGHSKMPNYNNGYSNGVRLQSGLNIIPLGSDGSALYINYLVHTFDKSTRKFANKLSGYDDLKVHVEGGYINGYYNVVGDELYQGDTDTDWVYYEERANLENITILGRYEVLQFELNDVVHTETDKNGKENTWEHRGLAALFPEELPESLPENQRINAIIEAWDRIFLSEKMALGVASRADVDSMNKLYPRWDGEWKEKAEIYNYDDKLLAFCDSLNKRDGDYGEYYNHHGLAFGTRTGYMYGSWDHSGYHINTTPSILTAIATEAGPTWGPAHEIGHQHQALYTLNGEMEVTNNTFANIAVWYMGMGTSRINATDGNLAHVYDNFREGNFLLQNNIWALTHRYYRLWLYYHRVGNNTQFFPRLFELIRKNPMERSYSSGSEMRPNDKGVMEKVGFQLTNGYRSYLHFYQLCCEAAQEDLTEFFRAYGCFVPVNGAFVGDYTNSKYYTTQEEIDQAIAEVKAKNYPINNKILFINDCTPDRTYGHDGKTLREYWDGNLTSNGTNAEVGCYVDYLSKDSITGQYLYSLVNLNKRAQVIIEGGDGAVGFAVYNSAGEIQAFSNHHQFVITNDVYTKIRSGAYTLVAVSPIGEDVVIENKAKQGTPEEQLTRLQEALKVAKNYLAKSDSTGTKVGFLIPDSVKEYAALIDQIDTVIAKADTSVYKYGEWYVNLDAANADVEIDASKRVPFVPYCFYSISTAANRYMVNTASGLATSTEELSAKDKQWMFVLNEDGTCYIQHRATGYYIGAISRNGERVKATSSDAKKAETFVLVPSVPGELILQVADNESFLLSVDRNSQVRVDSKGGWVVQLEDAMLDMPKVSEGDQLDIYYLLRADNGKYAFHSTLRAGKDRVSTEMYDDPEDSQYWFYFLDGGEEGKYTIYNYDYEKEAHLPLTVKDDSLLFVGKEADAAEDFGIALDKDSTAVVISSEQGRLYMEDGGVYPFAEMSTVDSTLWKLQHVRTISLINEPLTSITLVKTAVTIAEGDSLQLEFTTAPKYATNHTVSWMSSNADIASVDSTGMVRANAVGSAEITATAKDGSDVKATCKITVNKKDTGISNTMTGALTIQNQGSVVTVSGLAKGALVSVYDTAGKLVATVVAVDGAVTIDTGLAIGSTIIVKVDDNHIKTSLQ